MRVFACRCLSVCVCVYGRAGPRASAYVCACVYYKDQMRVKEGLGLFLSDSVITESLRKAGRGEFLTPEHQVIVPRPIGFQHQPVANREEPITNGG